MTITSKLSINYTNLLHIFNNKTIHNYSEKQNERMSIEYIIYYKQMNTQIM